MQNTKMTIPFTFIKPITTYLFVFVMLTTLLNIAGCTSVSNYVWTPYAKISIVADKDVNPDLNNRPSPVQIKIYELSSRTTFDNLNFDALFNHSEAQLSDELLTEATFFLQPGETLNHEITMQEQASYIAVLAAYRDIDNVKWRYLYKVEPQGYYWHNLILNNTGIIAGKIIEKTQQTEQKKEVQVLSDY
ncbi:hypothetical protein MNBD_GAMMA03-1707 [hydrothermal vent metagenome]|uniref:Type VI secretion lipoprotein/VasD n=1 Tax=hydrothermal vent metagenome TaxID=652676 RepID=A0A3B0WLQ8_9ZZZZ